MAKVITTELQHAGASGANITLDSSKNVTFGGNVTVTGTLPADKLTGALPAISGASLTNLPASGKGTNLMVNGQMQVAQRGTSSTTGNDYVVDRWMVQWASVDEALTMSQADVVADTPAWNAGFRKCAKLQNGNQTSDAQAASTALMAYNFEAQDLAQSGWDYTSASSYVTLSFWVKSSVAQDFPFYWRSRDGTNRMYSMMTGSLSADTWTKVTKTIPGDSTGNLTINNDTGRGMQFLIAPFYGTDGTVSSGSTLNAWKNWTSTSRWNNITVTWFETNDATFEVTGVKVEVGSSATDYDFKTYGEDLLECQRYYQRLGHQMIWAGRGNGSSSFVFGVPLPVALRAASPTITMSGTLKTFETDATSESTTLPTAGYGYGDNAAAIALVQTGHSGLTDDRCINGYIHGTDSYLALESEP